MSANFLTIDNLLSLGSVRDVTLSASPEPSAKNLFNLPEVDESAQVVNTFNTDPTAKIEKCSANQPAQMVIDLVTLELPPNSPNSLKTHNEQTGEISSQTESAGSLAGDIDKTVQLKGFEDIVKIIAGFDAENAVAATGKTENSTGKQPVLIATSGQFVSTTFQPGAGGVKPEAETVTVEQKNVTNNQSQSNNPSAVLDASSVVSDAPCAERNTQYEGRNTINATGNPALQESANKTIIKGQSNPAKEPDSRNPIIELLQTVSSTGKQVTGENARYPKEQGSTSTDKGIGINIQQSSSGSQVTAGPLEIDSSNIVRDAAFVKSNTQYAGHNTITSSDISRQILDSIHSSLTGHGPNSQITVRLNPPELGQVVIKFQGRETQITGLLEVSNIQIRAELEQSLPQIVKNLADSGIEVKRLEVTLSNNTQSEHQAQKEQSFLNSEQQRHNWSHQGNYPLNADGVRQDDWLSYANSYPENNAMFPTSAAEDSINILL